MELFANEIISSIIAFVVLSLIIYKLFRLNGILITNDSKINALLKIDKTYIKNIFLNNILTNSMNYIIVLIILFYTNYETLGVYSLLSSMTFFISIILLSVNSVLKPIISKLFTKNDINAIKYYFRISSKIIFVMTTPIFFITVFLIDIIAIQLKLNLSDSKSLFLLLLFASLLIL